jgi:homoserine dehydrogenase
MGTTRGQDRDSDCGRAGCQVDPDDIPCRTISRSNTIDFTYARKLDCTIRQVSWAERAPGPDQQLFASVRPALVPLSSPLARAQGSQNLVTVQGEFGGETPIRALAQAVIRRRWPWSPI